MRYPRISVRIVMAAGAVVAFDCMALRSVQSRPGEMILPFELIVFGGLPMLNLLMIGLLPLSRGRGASRPFLRGFQIGGWPALVTSLGFASLKPGWILAGAEPVLTFLMDSLGSLFPPSWDEGVGLALASALFLLPQLLLALAGGLLGRLLGKGRGIGAPVAVPIAEPARRKFPLGVMATFLILVAAPPLAIEGALRWKIDPKLARLPAGTAALVDLSEEHSSGYWAPLPEGDILLGNGTRVSVADDSLPSSIGVNDSWGKGPTVERRLVQVTISEGRGAGRTTQLSRSHLRPAPRP